MKITKWFLFLPLGYFILILSQFIPYFIVTLAFKLISEIPVVLNWWVILLILPLIPLAMAFSLFIISIAAVSATYIISRISPNKYASWFLIGIWLIWSIKSNFSYCRESAISNTSNGIIDISLPCWAYIVFTIVYLSALLTGVIITEIIKQGNGYKFHQVEFKQSLKNRIKKIFKTRTSDKRIPLVLLIEEDEILAGMHRTKLQQEGLDVKISRDGEDGLRQAKELLPDIILLDLILPKMDGFKVLEELKKDSRLSKIPIMRLNMIEQEKEISGKEMYEEMAAHMPSEIAKRAKQIILERKAK